MEKCTGVFCVVPGRLMFSRVKVPNMPDSGKNITKKQVTRAIGNPNPTGGKNVYMHGSHYTNSLLLSSMSW